MKCGHFKKMQNVNAQFVIGPFLYFNVGSSSSSPSWSSQLIIQGYAL